MSCFVIKISEIFRDMKHLKEEEFKGFEPPVIFAIYIINSEKCSSHLSSPGVLVFKQTFPTDVQLAVVEETRNET